MRIRPLFSRKGILAVILSLLALVGGDHFLTGRVVSVADGDTLSVYSSPGGTQRVRLYGIDCPESSQPGGTEATRLTRSLALYKKVELSVVNKDRYGRQVGIVRLENGTILNEELLRKGHAWLYAAYCKTPRCVRWKSLELAARKARLGLWKAKKPIPPWKWRMRGKH